MLRVRDGLLGLSGYHSPQIDVAVRLNTNESPVGPPAEFVERLAAAVAQIDWNRYPDREATELRRALAIHHGVEPEQVFVANGSNEVIQTLLLTYGGHGRSVATFEPTYQLHAHLARIAGASVVSGERTSDFELDPAEVRRVLVEHRPDVVFVCSPNNPTGLVDDPALLTQLASASDHLMVVDEAYAQFSDWSAISLIDDSRSLAVVRTFSKTWSMAAARLGYLIGPAWLIAELDKVVLPYHLDALSQIAGRLALDYDTAMRERVRALVAERDRLTAALGSLGLHVVPSGANFILFRPADGDGRRLWQGLVDRGVLIRDCSSWSRLDGYVRVTVGTAEENDAFLMALQEALI